MTSNFVSPDIHCKRITFMTDQYILGAYWHARRQSIEQCAQLLQRFLWQIGQFDSSLAAWFERGRSRREALSEPIDADSLSRLEALVKKGQHRRDSAQTVNQELGFQIGLWNGQSDDRAAGLNVTCGLYWESQHPNVGMSNCVVLNLPENLGSLSDPEKMSGLLACVARIWQPDRASIMSRAAMTARQFNGNKPFMDWMAYLPAIITGIEPPATAMPVADLGTIIISQNQPPTITDPAAQKQIAHLQSILNQA